MKTIPQQLRPLGWNRRVLTLDDFYTACAQEGVLVQRAKLKWRGLYLVYKKRPIILLNERLRGPELLLVAWHEFGHHLWHAPGAFGHPSKTEYEADFFAHVALIPQFLLHFSDGEIAEMFGYDQRVIRRRVEMFRTHNQ